jgi:hypothetical protein
MVTEDRPRPRVELRAVAPGGASSFSPAKLRIRSWRGGCHGSRASSSAKRSRRSGGRGVRDMTDGPDAHEIAHGTRREAPGRTGTGWDDAAPSILLEGLIQSRRAPANTPRGQFRSRWGNPWGFESPRSHTLPTRAFAFHLLSPTAALRPSVDGLSTGRVGSWSPSPRIRRATVSAAWASRPGSTWLGVMPLAGRRQPRPCAGDSPTARHLEAPHAALLDIPHALRRQPAAPVAPPSIQQRPVGTP